MAKRWTDLEPNDCMETGVMLERLIDRIGLPAILDILAMECSGKADHVGSAESPGQPDTDAAQEWIDRSLELDQLADDMSEDALAEIGL